MRAFIRSLAIKLGARRVGSCMLPGPAYGHTDMALSSISLIGCPSMISMTLICSSDRPGGWNLTLM